MVKQRKQETQIKNMLFFFINISCLQIRATTFLEIDNHMSRNAIKTGPPTWSNTNMVYKHRRLETEF